MEKTTEYTLPYLREATQYIEAGADCIFILGAERPSSNDLRLGDT